MRTCALDAAGGGQQYDLLILAQWADPTRSDELVAWARGAFDALRPHQNVPPA